MSAKEPFRHNGDRTRLEASQRQGFLVVAGQYKSPSSCCVRGVEAKRRFDQRCVVQVSRSGRRCSWCPLRKAKVTPFTPPVTAKRLRVLPELLAFDRPATSQQLCSLVMTP